MIEPRATPAGGDAQPCRGAAQVRPGGGRQSGEAAATQSGARAGTRPGDNVGVAALLQLVGSLLFVGLAALVKLAGDEATPMQAVLYRSVFSMLPLLLEMARRRISPIGRRWRLLVLRGVAGYLALFGYFYAIAHIHLANTLALQQLAPIFVAFFSVWLLGERPRALHYLLAGVCLGGAMLVVRPDRGLLSVPSLVAVGSALFSALAYVSVRALTRSEPTPRIVLWFSIVASVLALPFVLPGWRWPGPRASLLLVGAGLLAAPAQALMTAAYRRAPAHVAAVFSYVSVPLAYLSGVVVWGERPDHLANLGIGLIVTGGAALVASLRGGHERDRHERGAEADTSAAATSEGERHGREDEQGEDGAR